jgi:RNA polymerase subunit RPABC4/transcription elongation factor Spt4
MAKVPATNAEEYYEGYTHPRFSEEVDAVYYNAIKVNEYSKAYKCPHCENEAPAKGDHCKICGSDIVNHCCDTFIVESGKLAKGCDTLLDGDARYCPKCGNEGNFYQKGWLNDWKAENVKQAIRNSRSEGKALPFIAAAKPEQKVKAE